MKNSQSDFITFRQFFNTLNLRYAHDNVLSNYVIKINCRKNIDAPYCEDNYLEIGWFDYTEKDIEWETLKRYLSSNILNSYVESIIYDSDENELKICLVEEI